MKPPGFFSELKRRNVYKVAVAYAVIAWLLIQAGSILFPTFEAPGWVMKGFVTVIAAGFPIALVIAWTFEMTPEGMKRTENVPPNEFNPQWSRRKFAALIASGAIAAGGLLLFQFTRLNPAANHAQRDGVSAKSIAILPFENLSEDKAAFQREQPANARIVCGLAAAQAGLGNKEAALREGERSVAMLPATEDPVVGPIVEELLAHTEAEIGELDHAVTRLERLLTTPYGSYPITQAVLRLDPSWDPLRSHPRFQKLVSGPEPKTIYK